MGRRELIVVGRVVALLVIAVLLQVVVISHVSILGVTADLFLILTVILAVCRGSLEAAVFGFFAGLIADIAYFSPLGVRSFVYVLVGYFAGVFVARFAISKPWSVVVLAAVSSFVAQFLYGLFQYIMGPRGGLLTMVGTQMLPEVVLDALITAPLYVLLVRTRLLPVRHMEAAQFAGVDE